MALELAATTTACVGSDDGPSTNGIQNGPCTANGTCNAGLECVRGHCQAAVDAASGSACGGKPPASPLRSILCGTKQCNIDQGDGHCCESDTTADTTCIAYETACPAAHHDWQCVNLENCASGNVCCLVPLAQSTTCPATAGNGGTRCAASCIGTEVSLCLEDAHCTGGKTCQPLDIVGSDPRSVGACL